MSSARQVSPAIAVVGMACLLPGAGTPQEFWAALRGGADNRRDGGAEEFGTTPDVPGGWGDDAHRITATRGGFVTEPALDFTGLAVPADELAGLDRVVRWPLGVARAALADAGLADTGTDALRRTGIVLGNYSFPTESSVRRCVPMVRRAVTDGLRRGGLPVPPAPDHGDSVDPRNLWPSGLPAALISSALRLGGPSLALDAACSSTLYGLALARDYLTVGAADVMLAAAVCAPDPLLIHLSFSDLNAFPRNGISQPFDARSTGIVTGQGAGVFVLKRLDDAVADGDQVHAVIESIGLSNDGAGRHLLTPNVSGQLDAYARAYAGIDPSTVDYVECHATGTPLGDATELRGLTEFFGSDVPLLGSVKGNFGHLLTVAGFTSMLKAILAMRHGIIPATPGVAEPLTGADRVVLAERPWPARDDGRAPRAAVSAFGFGGTNAHVVLSGSAAATPAVENRPAVVENRPATPRLAITGLGVRLGPLSGTDELHAAARTATPALRPRPAERWYGLPADGVPERDGGFTDSVSVDARTYRIPPAELANANPQHLVLFEAAEQALADAGYAAPPPGTRADELPPRRVAVVIAVEAEPRSHTHRARFDIGAHVRAAVSDVDLDGESMAALERAVRTAVHDDIGANEVLSYIGNVMASRISSSRNLTGPSFTISTDATAGARAIEVAGLLLLDPSIEAVLVGGVDLAAGLENTAARAELAGDSPLPPLGDGAAALVLTRADDAAHRVYAVIDDVRLSTGDPAGLVTDGLSDVDYLELCGPAPSELAAGLAGAYSGGEPYSCVLGSLTELVGDTGHASVLAGVVKTALCLYRAELPASPSSLSSASSSSPGASGDRFTAIGEPQPWLLRERDHTPVAAVGAADPLTGSVAHLVLRGADTADAAPSEVLLLVLRADDGDGLAAQAREHAAALRDGADPARLCAATVHSGRSGRLTAVLVATDADRLARELEAAERDLPRAVADGEEWATPAGSYCTARPIGPDGRIAFVYPGAFTTYPGAGRDLFRLFPLLRKHFEASADRPRSRFKHGALYPRSSGPMDRGALMRHEGRLIEDIPVMLAAGTNFAVLHTQLLRDVLGVVPHGGFGYSLGESSMLFAMGVWDEVSRDDTALAATPFFRDRLRGPKTLVRELWELPADTPDSAVWSTHLLLAGEDRVRSAMAGLDRVFLTHVNTPGEVVIAGDPAACKALIERVGCQSAKAPANHVMHVPLVDVERAGLAELNSYPLGSPAPGLELLSAYDYDTVDVSDRAAIADRISWTLRSTIDFARLIRTAYERGYRYFVEVGPGATCTRWIGDTLAGSPHVAVSVDRRGAALGLTVARLLARLASHGVPVDLSALAGHAAGPAAETATASRRGLVRLPIGGESVVDRVAAATAAVLADTRAADDARADDAVLADTRADADIRADARADADNRADGGRPTVEVPAQRSAADAELTPRSSVPREVTTVPEPTVIVPEPADDAITVEGEPFVYLPTPLAQPTPAPARDAYPYRRLQATPTSTRIRNGGGIRAIAGSVAASHRAVLAAHDAIQQAALLALEGGIQHGTVAPIAGHDLTDRRTRAHGSPDTGSSNDGHAVWGEAELLEFATGRVANVFGDEFAVIDSYPARVRLPEPPYLFVSRVTDLKATTGRFEPSTITTEYDIPHDAWYSVDGLTPCAVTIEAGQCDLLLISYLGIDFRNKGERVYRLLDSKLVFHGALPRAGQTLRYDIAIDRFVWNDDTLLFFFKYKCYADGELILELLDACAGFFSAAELDDSLGVVETEADRRRRAAMTPAWFKPLARTEKRRLTADDLRLLAEGRRAEVFGPDHEQDREPGEGVNRSVRLPGEMLRMIDEVTEIDRLGGPRGLGELTAMKYLDPDGWYFTCHFPGDPVLAGSLVAEGGVQLLQTYAMYLGMHLVFPDAEFQSVPGLQTEVKVRGQITPGTPNLRYHAEITDLTMLPRPTVIADIVVYDGDKPIISMRNFGIQVREKPGTPYRPETGGVPAYLGRRSRSGEVAFINELHLAHAAKGDLATAMGPEFGIYAERRAPYIPNGDFQFVDRIMRLDGTRGVLRPGATMATEYDSPPEAWYYRENAFPGMPNCVYMETSLQAAILLGYYLGATLASPDEELSIRNLDGHATVTRQLDLRGRTIRHESELLSSQAVPGATLQNFRYRLTADGEPFYEGESLFGYFSAEALANQVGLDAGRYVAPWLDEHPDADVRTLKVRSDDRWFDRSAPLRLGDGHLRLVDEVDLVDGGGEHGRGYLRGRRVIDPADWYFDCHFHRDPVMPGSLGVEAILQALQLFVIDNGLADGMQRPVFAQPLGVAMGWRYRGQILRTDREMTFDAHIKEVRREDGRLLVIADANLWKPGLRIYQLTDIAVEVREERP